MVDCAFSIFLSINTLLFFYNDITNNFTVTICGPLLFLLTSSRRLKVKKARYIELTFTYGDFYELFIGGSRRPGRMSWLQLTLAMGVF